MKILFQDGTVIEYPTAVNVSANDQRTMVLLHDAAGDLVAEIPWFEVKNPEAFI